MQRQEHADAVGFGADAAHQVAGAFGPEVVERQVQQVVKGGGAQVCANAFGHQRQQIGARPVQRPAQHRRAQQTTQNRGNFPGFDLLAVLKGNQHIVHQRNRQIRRHQRGSGGRQREQKPAEQLEPVGPGKTPQAQQHPGRRRCAQGLGTHRAGLAVWRQQRLTFGAQRDVVFSWLVGLGLGKQPNQAQRLNVDRQGETPHSQPRVTLVQCQRANAGMVGMAKAQGRHCADRPARPDAAGAARQQTLVGQRQSLTGIGQCGVQVNHKGTQHVFLGCQLHGQTSQCLVRCGLMLVRVALQG